MPISTDLFSHPVKASSGDQRTAPLVDLMNHPDALWLCRMGTPIEDALKQIGALASTGKHG